MSSGIFTIGYSPFSLKDFVNLIKEYKIDVVADVRSVPYSRYKPEFNSKYLKSFLMEHNKQYVFLGEELGGRIKDENCYIDGKSNYSLIQNNQLFKYGISRLKKGILKYKIALMCAEKDPIDCHRAILISRHLRNENIAIDHIMHNGNIESNKALESRLLYLCGFAFNGTGKSPIEDAYDRQWNKISYPYR